MSKVEGGDGPLKDLQDRRGRSTKEINEIANSGQAAPTTDEERVPAPGDPDYKPLESESSVWEPHRWDQIKYAAGQYNRDHEQSSD